MVMTRFGYHSLVILWLAVLGLIDVICNTMVEGVMSDVYFYKVFLDGALVWWTISFLREDIAGTVTHAHAAAGVSARGRANIVAVDLGAGEYIYYGFLTLYGFGNLVFHHQINKASTGSLSIGTLVLSLVDVMVSAVAVMNFVQVMQGKLVRLQQQQQGQQGQ